eukprot:TRINITY_DN1465_c0_g1_i11.p1 TRINITY_DN1465_c0_g1~~TRINITY_DN1465_c0_g1_i11.p1  ORF type:complete len:738 (-),score=200.44 TRINITY_DN1465_c0_g1_i11:1178-3391(-)
MVEHRGSSTLFAVFILSILMLFLVPYTIYKICFKKSKDEEVVQPWEEDGKKTSEVSIMLRKMFTVENVAIVLMWGICIGLMIFVSTYNKEIKPFDPYDILQVQKGANETQVKQAYRKLSLIWHPDKNKSPEAPERFNNINNAYKALNDPVSRENYERYGHPDGPTGTDIGVALPEWFFTSDKTRAPVLLSLLVVMGVLMPLGIMACYLNSNKKGQGPNQVMMETRYWWLYDARIGIKEAQSLSKVPDTIMTCMEFLLLNTTQDQGPGLVELQRICQQYYSDLKDKAGKFYRRKGGIVKAHLMMLAHLERQCSNIDKALVKDYHFVCKKLLLLTEEFIKLSGLPRTKTGQGWITPFVSGVDFMQSIVRGVPLGLRKSSGVQEASQAPILQLPHMNADIAKRLSRKKGRGLEELQSMSEEDLVEALQGVNLKTSQIKEIRTALLAVPVISINGYKIQVEDEEDVKVGDIVTCSLKVTLHRGAHQLQNDNNKKGKKFNKGKTVAAYAPYFPLPKEEVWYGVACDPSSNVLWGYSKLNLMEAEKIAIEGKSEEENGQMTSGEIPENGAETTSTSGMSFEGSQSSLQSEGYEDAVGQKIEIKFMAGVNGKFDLTLLLTCDSWIGCEKVLLIKNFKIEILSRAEAEGRVQRGKAVKEAQEDEVTGEIDEEDEEDEDEEDDYSYDSDETGTEITADEDDDDEEEEEEEEEEQEEQIDTDKNQITEEEKDDNGEITTAKEDKKDK